MARNTTDGVVAVVKGLFDDDNPDVKRRTQSITRWDHVNHALHVIEYIVGPERSSDAEVRRRWRGPALRRRAV